MKPIYPVLVGSSVKVYPTNLFASLPQHDKFLVNERLHDPTVGFSRAKLALKSSFTEVKEDLRCKDLNKLLFACIAIAYVSCIYTHIVY